MFIDRAVQAASLTWCRWLLVAAALFAHLFPQGMQAGDPPTHTYQLPLQFVRNAGQWPSYVRYMMLPAENRVVFLEDGVMFQVRREKSANVVIPLEVATNSVGQADAEGYEYVIMRFVDPSPNMHLEEVQPSETKMNFYVGDSSTWREDVGCSRGIVYRNAWDGVDLHFNTDGTGMRQVLTRANGSTVTPRFHFEGENDAVKRLQAALNWWGGGDAGKTPVLAFDSLRPRVPDRIPTDSTYYWTEYAKYFPTSRGDSATFHQLGVDLYGRVTLSGHSWFPNMPTTTNAHQRVANIDMSLPHHREVRYFGRLRCDGRTLDYLSYYGAMQFTIHTGGKQHLFGGRHVFNNQVYMLDHVMWDTFRNDTSARFRYYPPTSNALEHEYQFEYLPQFPFLSRFDSSGHLAYASVVCKFDNNGDAFDDVFGIGKDGYVYVVSTTPGPLPYIRPGVFLDTASFLRNRTFLLKLIPTCDSVVYCTYLPAGTRVFGVDADAEGHASIIATSNGTFPTKNAFQPGFRGASPKYDLLVARFSPLGDSLMFATYLGGGENEGVSIESGHRAIQVAPGGRTYIVATTESEDFPLYRPLQADYRGRVVNLYERRNNLVLAGFEPDGRVIFSTYWGGAGNDFARTFDITPCGDLLISGSTWSRDFPIVSPPAFHDTATTWRRATYEYATFMLLLDPSTVSMRSSFFHPDPYYFHGHALDSAGYMHSIGYVHHAVPMYNGYQRPSGAPGLGNYPQGVFRQYFPLCGEDLLVARPLIPDTIQVDSVRQYISQYEFTLAVELHNRDNRRTAINTRSTIELPFGIVLIEGEPAIKTPVPDIIPPGGTALVSWKLRLDTSKLGGWAGLRDLVLNVKITHEYQLSSALESCLTSFAWSDIPLYVKRKDSEITLVCDVSVTDSLRLSDDERGFIPPVITVSGVVTNTGSASAGPGTVALRLGNMGSHLEPPGDSLRIWPVLAPGDSWPVSWTVVPGKRLDPRTLLAEMVVMDEKGSITACTESIPIPALPPLRCALQGPDTVRILKSGELVPPDIFTRILLSNVLDTLVGGAEVELDLLGVTHLRMWSGDTLRKLLGFVMPGGVRDARWQLELAQTPTRPTVVPVTVRYRCEGIRDWSECIKNIVLLPMTSDLLCSITAPAALSEADVESRSEVKLDYTLRNSGLIPEMVDRIELTISPTSGVLALDALSQPGGALAPSGDISRQWRLRPLALRNPRTAHFEVTAYGAADSVLSVCTHDMHIPGIDGLLCDITALDSVRFIRDELRYDPDPVAVTMDLRNVLDAPETNIEAEIDLTAAPRFELATGETAVKTLASIDSNSSAQLQWLLHPLADINTEAQDITIRYRSLEQGVWKECRSTIIIEAWPRESTVRCVVSGHDSLHADAAYERLIPEPFEISYTATNTGTVALRNCAATIILPPEFELVSDSATLSFGTLHPTQSNTRWWTLKTTSALAGYGAYPVNFSWQSDEQGSVAGCDHTVHIVPEASSGIVFTPLHLHFEAERNDPLPAAQYIQLWTGGGLSMPWTAQGGQWWLNADPATGDHAARIAVQPNSTDLPIGLHSTALTIAGQAPNLPKNVAVTYRITGLVGVAPSNSITTFGLGPIWPQPVPLNGEARISINVPAGEYVRVALYDALGREVAVVKEGAMPEQELMIRYSPATHRLTPGLYLLRMISSGGQSVRGVVVR
jgi:hypothetical protein